MWAAVGDVGSRGVYGASVVDTGADGDGGYLRVSKVMMLRREEEGGGRHVARIQRLPSSWFDELIYFFLVVCALLER